MNDNGTLRPDEIDLSDVVRRLREATGTLERVRRWTTGGRDEWPIAKAHVAALLSGAGYTAATDVDEQRAAFIARSPETAQLRQVVEALPGTIRRQRAEHIADVFDHVTSCDSEGCGHCRTFALSWGLDVWKQLRGEPSARVRIESSVDQ